jgi:hypothetical protein
MKNPPMEHRRIAVQGKTMYHRSGDLRQRGGSFFEQPHKGFFLFLMALKGRSGGFPADLFHDFTDYMLVF